MSCDTFYIFDCPNPKGHFGYGHSHVCYFPVGARELADRVFQRYTKPDGQSVHKSVLEALDSFQPTPHPDSGYSEPIRD